MRILVTGASGYLARHLIPALLDAGHLVACLTRDPAALPKNWTNLPTGVADRSGHGIRSLCATFKPDVVVHLAAGYKAEHCFDDIAGLIDANILLSTHLLEAMHEAGCHSLVWAGTAWQHYEGADYRPVNLYAAMKQAVSTLAEYYLDTAGLRLLELHLYDSYGEDDPRQRLLNQLQASVASERALALSPGEQRLHLVHVDDLAQGFLMACTQIAKQPAGTRRIFRLPSASAVTIRELVALFDAADPARPTHVNWSARPYRQREVFTPWESGEILPGWQPSIDLASGLRRLRLQQAGSR